MAKFIAMNDLDQYSTLTELKQMFKDMNADAVFVFNYKTVYNGHALLFIYFLLFIIIFLN